MLCNICDDYQKRISQVEEKPPLDWLDAGRAGEGGGDGEVDGGQHHHARDVDCDDQVIRGVSPDVVGGLVDDVHQDGGEVGHHEDAYGVFS